MLDFNKLEEIIDKFREELTLANRSGEEELNAFLTKHNISLEKDHRYPPAVFRLPQQHLEMCA